MLPSFAYVRPTSVDEAARAAGGARRARPRAAAPTCSAACATASSRADTRRQPRRRSHELRGIAATADGGLRIGALTTIAEIAAHPTIAERYRALAAGGRRRRQPAAAQPGHARRQPVPAAALLVLPRRLPLRAQGRRHVLRRRRREPATTAIFGGETLLHRPPVGHRPGARRARRQRPHRRARGQPRRPARAFFVAPSTRTSHGRPCWSPARSSPRSCCRRRLPARERRTARCARAARGTSRWPASPSSLRRRRRARSRRARVVLVRRRAGAVAGAGGRAGARRPDASTRATIARPPRPRSRAPSRCRQNGYKVPLLRGVVEEALTTLI